MKSLGKMWNGEVHSNCQPGSLAATLPTPPSSGSHLCNRFTAPPVRSMDFLSSPFTCPQGLPRLCPSLPTMAFLPSSPATLTWSLLQPAHPLCPSHLPSALVRELALVHALRRVSLPETLTCQDVSWLVCSGIISSAEGML